MAMLRSGFGLLPLILAHKHDECESPQGRGPGDLPVTVQLLAHTNLKFTREALPEPGEPLYFVPRTRAHLPLDSQSVFLPPRPQRTHSCGQAEKISRITATTLPRSLFDLTPTLGHANRTAPKSKRGGSRDGEPSPAARFRTAPFGRLHAAFGPRTGSRASNEVPPSSHWAMSQVGRCANPAL